MAETKYVYLVFIVTSLITVLSATYIPCIEQVECASLEDYIARLVDAQVEKKLTSGELVRRDDVETLMEKKLAARERVLRGEMEATIVNNLKAQELVLFQNLKEKFEETFRPRNLFQNIESKSKIENDVNRKFTHEKEVELELAGGELARNDLMKTQIEQQLTNETMTQRKEVEKKRGHKRGESIANESTTDELLGDEKLETLQERIELLENKTIEKSNKEARTIEITPAMTGISRVAHQVGFTACVTSDVVTLGDTHTIVFDKVISNTGGAYHYHTGIFIAPVKGMYVFHVSATSSPNKGQQLGFVKDAVEISPVFPNAIGTNTYQTAGSEWVLELEQGSEVWIQTKGGGQIYGHCFTVFTGFLLSEME